MRHEIVSRHTLDGSDVEKLVRSHLGLSHSDKLTFRFRPGQGGGPEVQIQRDDADKPKPKAAPKRGQSRRNRVKLGLEAVAEQVHRVVVPGDGFNLTDFSRSISTKMALRDLELAATTLHKLAEGGKSDAEQVAFIDLQRTLTTLTESYGLKKKAS